MSISTDDGHRQVPRGTVSSNSSNNSLTRAFEAGPTVVTRALKHGYATPNIQGKASALVPVEAQANIQWIRLNSQKQGI
jgi:hypothetical protein